LAGSGCQLPVAADRVIHRAHVQAAILFSRSFHAHDCVMDTSCAIRSDVTAPNFAYQNKSKCTVVAVAVSSLRHAFLTGTIRQNNTGTAGVPESLSLVTDSKLLYYSSLIGTKISVSSMLRIAGALYQPTLHLAILNTC
jgi:hypothetical protein